MFPFILWFTQLGVLLGTLQCSIRRGSAVDLVEVHDISNLPEILWTPQKARKSGQCLAVADCISFFPMLPPKFDSSTFLLVGKRSTYSATQLAGSKTYIKCFLFL